MIAKLQQLKKQQQTFPYMDMRIVEWAGLFEQPNG